MQAVAIPFSSRSWRVSPQYIDVVKQQAKLCLSLAPAYIMVYVMVTDKDIDSKLQFQRAQAIKDELVAFGIRPTRILLSSVNCSNQRRIKHVEAASQFPSFVSDTLGSQSEDANQLNSGYSVLLVKRLLS